MGLPRDEQPRLALPLCLKDARDVAGRAKAEASGPRAAAVFRLVFGGGGVAAAVAPEAGGTAVAVGAVPTSNSVVNAATDIMSVGGCLG